jgi:hypothetical protein
VIQKGAKTTAVLCCGGVVQAYLRSLSACSEDDGSDGSCEAALVNLWPLDGSAAAGKDLREFYTQRIVKQHHIFANTKSYGPGFWLPGGYEQTMARLEKNINKFFRYESWFYHVVWWPCGMGK